MKNRPEEWIPAAVAACPGNLALVLLILGLSGLLGAGCKTTETTTSGAVASVELHGNTPGQISDVTTEVFRENGYTLASRRRDGLVFERQGSKFSNFAYGNWVGDVPVWTRVKIFIVPAGEAAFRVECVAYNVRDKGGTIEEELRITKLGKAPYQKLLDQIAARFKPKAAHRQRDISSSIGSSGRRANPIWCWTQSSNAR